MSVTNTLPTWEQVRAYMLAQHGNTVTAGTAREILSGMGVPYGSFLAGTLRRKLDAKEPGLREDRRLGMRGASVWWIEAPSAEQPVAQPQPVAQLVAQEQALHMHALTPVFGAIAGERLGQRFERFDALTQSFFFAPAGPWQNSLKVLRRCISRPEAHLNLSTRHDNGNPHDELEHAINGRLGFLATVAHVSESKKRDRLLPLLCPCARAVAGVVAGTREARRELRPLRRSAYQRGSACWRAAAP